MSPVQLAQLLLDPPDPTPAQPKATESDDRTRTLSQIRDMARVLPKPGFLLACLLMLQQSGWLNAAQLHYFQGAVIFGKTDWDTIPPEMTQKLMQAVRLERFWLLLEEAEQGTETQRCTPAELVCAIQPYTHVAPIQPRYSELVVWAFGEMLNQHPDIFGQATASWNGITQAETVRLPDRDTVLEVGRKVRRSVINSAKSAQRKSDPPTEAPEPVAVAPQPPEAIQFNLFGL
jgi:hypothetical protein